MVRLNELQLSGYGLTPTLVQLKGYIGNDYRKNIELDRIQKEIGKICEIERIEEEIGTNHHQSMCESSPTSSNTMGTIELVTERETVCTIKLVNELEVTLPQKEQHYTQVSNTMTVNNIEQHKPQFHNSARVHTSLEPVTNLPSSIKRLTVPGEI